ncbi:Tetraspanin [Gryllus bimaculatus]|nr:Tetraspanin [Gryllus bimaculatus]
MVSGGMSLVKCLLFIFNLLFVISGITILVIGVLALYPYKEYATFMDPKFAAGPIILITVGSIIFIIAFFGCCGAIKENNCMLITYAILLLTIFTVQLAAGICGYIYRHEVKRGAEKEIIKSMDNYNSDVEIRDAWNILQSDGIPLPSSCCKHLDAEKMCKLSNSYSIGCSSVLKDKIEHYALIIGGVAIGIAFVQLLGVILACCLGRSIRKEYNTV